MLSSISSNLHTLRITSSQQSQDIKRLESKNAELERQLALCTTQEKTAKATLRSAESKNRTLREEMARLRLTVAQIRAQCANDIRKRDAEIARLKKHIEGRRGRDGAVGQVGVVVITPGVTKPSSSLNRNEAMITQSLNPEASLKDDTAAFLTDLSRDLTTENQSLSALLQDTLDTLLSLQGLPTPSEDPSHSPSRAGPSNIESLLSDPNVSVSLPPSFTQLSNSLTSALSHLRALLTSPSFVPLEELEAREDEIVRLRAGWEKMEARWHEAVTMMNGWRQRMEESGDTIKLEDLQQGLTLGVEAAEIEMPEEGPVNGGVRGFNEGRSAVSERTEDEDTLRLPAPTPLPPPRISDLPIPNLRPPTRLPALSPSPPILSPSMPSLRPLSPTTGNQTKPQASPRKSSPLPLPAQQSLVKSAVQLKEQERSSSPDPLNHLLDSPAKHDEIDSSSLQSDDPANFLLSPYPAHKGDGREDDQDPLFDFSAIDVGGAKHEGEDGLSVKEKLERAQLEAEKVRQAEKENGMVRNRVQEKPPKAKSKGRRRSTLSPDELQGLLGGV